MKRFIPLIMVLLLAIALAFVLDDFVNQVIVEPLLYITWLGGVILTSLPQFVFWLLFVLAALIILTKSLHFNASAPQYDREQKSIFTQGVIAPWQRLLQRAERQPHFRREMASSLAKLSQKTLTTADSLNADENQSLTAIINTLPPEISAYFQTELRRKPAVKLPWYKRAPARQDVEPKMDPEMVIEFLEKETAWESNDE